MMLNKFILSLLAIFMSFTMFSQLPVVSDGLIERHSDFDSKYVSPRNVDVWLPGFYTQDKKYSVIYMHDGQMLFDAGKTWNGQEWQVDEVITDLVGKGKIKECIVVGIWNSGETRWDDYNPQKAFESLPQDIRDSAFSARMKGESVSDNYLRFLVEELKPYIDRQYSTLPDEQNTYVMGSSMGGLISMYAICEYPEIFGGAACLSTHWVGDWNHLTDEVPESYIQYLKENLPDPKTHKIYFDYGTETIDKYYEPWQKKVNQVMKAAGYNTSNWMTKKYPGDAHSEESWARRLDVPLQFLLGKE